MEAVQKEATSRASSRTADVELLPLRALGNGGVLVHFALHFETVLLGEVIEYPALL